jgi:ribosomal protein S4E
MEAARNVPLDAMTSDAGAAVVDRREARKVIANARLRTDIARERMWTGVDFNKGNRISIIKGAYKGLVGHLVGRTGDGGKQAVVTLDAREGEHTIPSRYVFNA